MQLHTLFDSLRNKRSRTPRLQRRRSSLQRLISVEPLEIRNLPAAGLVVTDVTIMEGNTGVKQAAVVVNLSVPHGNAVTVDYRTVGGTATDGSDFTGVSGKLTFTKDQNSRTILVPVKGDRSAESDEQFTVVLSNAKGAKIEDGTAFVTIQDDEPRISITDMWADEGNAGTTPFKFTISLSAPSDLPVKVNYATSNGSADGSDYNAVADSYTFMPGETSKDIYVNVIGDHTIETNETFFVNLTSSDALVTKNIGTGTIADDEPQITIGDAYVYEGYGYTTMTFGVYLSHASQDYVYVDYATHDVPGGLAVAGVDYTETVGTLVFEPGQTYQEIYVPIANDTYNGQYFSVELSNAVNAPLAWSTAYGYWSYYYDSGWYDYGYYDYGYYYY